MEQLELKIPATLEQGSLGAIAAANIAAAYYRIVTGESPEKDCSFIEAVELAVGEACINSIRHCSAEIPEESSVSVCFQLEDDKLVVMIRDSNAPFDFDSVAPPDFDEVPESGYGIYLIKQIMDEVHYVYKDGQNVLTMKKIVSTGE